MRKIMFVPLLLLVLAGCGQNPAGAAAQPTSASPALPTPAAAPAPSATGGAAAPAPATPVASSKALAALAQQDLASYLSIAAEQISVVNTEEVEWPNGSLGCPQPGTMYPQVITSGYRLTLAAQGKQYDYHTNMKNRVVRCEQK